MSGLQIALLIFVGIAAIAAAVIYAAAINAPTTEEPDAADTDRAALDSIRGAVGHEPERRKVRGLS